MLVIVFLTFDWNRARPWVDDKVSQAIGRQFHITGDLKLGWQRPPAETGWKRWVPWPRFSAEKITVANPDWAKQPFFATLDEIDFQVALLPLLAHDIVIPSINLVNPSVDLERAQGQSQQLDAQVQAIDRTVHLEPEAARHRVREGQYRLFR